MNRPASVIALLPLLLLASGCGRGAVGEAVRPSERTAAEAMGAAQPTFDCTQVAPSSEPLVVDWPEQDRMNLTLALQEGVAVVHYGCDGLRLVKHCSLPGSYRFAGASMMQRVISLDSEDAVLATLPLQGASLSAEVGGSSSIDVALTIIGRRGTLVSKPARTDLQGQCDGATHYVRAAYVGAFSVATGTEGRARAAAEVFKASAGANSASKKSGLATDGDLAACESYESGEPPAKCQSPVRLELYPIVDAEGTDAAVVAAAPTESASPEPLENPCVDGFVLTDGKCTRKEQAEGYRCDPTDLAECEDQCGRGNADSCYNAGMVLARAGIHRPGTPVPPGQDYETMQKKASPFFEQACDGGVAPACNQLAGHYGNGSGGRTKDPAKAEALFVKACDALMFAQACSNLAGRIRFDKTRKKDPKRVAELYQRACDLGSAGGCGALGELWVEGKDGQPRDPKRGMEVLERACNEAKMPSLCASVSDYLAKGKHVPKDTKAAETYMARACAYGLRSKRCGG